MTSVKERYEELCALTQLYLMQEYSSQTRLLANKEDYLYFRAYVAQKQAAPSPLSPPPLQPQVESKPTFFPQPVVTRQSPLTVPIVQIQPIAKMPFKTELPSIAIPEPTEVKTTTKETGVVKPSVTPSMTQLAEKVIKENKTFIPAPLAAPEAIDLSDFQKILREQLPGLVLKDTIPDDAEAIRLSKLWEYKTQIPQILILSFDEAVKPQTFLANIAKALEVYGFHAQVLGAAKIEQEKGWEALLQSDRLRLIIASGYGIYSLPELLKSHREVAKQGRHYLGKTPLLLLSDITFYLKEPALKPSLWKALKELLVSNS